MTEDLPDYLTDDIESSDFEDFDARIAYEVPGVMSYEVDDEDLLLPREKGDNGVINTDNGATMEFTEELGASIINVEAWLHDHFLETIELDDVSEIGEGRFFHADLRNTELTVEFHRYEIVKAARQRAREDRSHFLYVLGNWAYLAEKNDHVTTKTARRFERFFEHAKQNSINPPEDATTDEFGGGKRDN